MSRHSIGVGAGGARLQAGIPKGSPRQSALSAGGLTLQGVVIAVYVYDSDSSLGPAQGSEIAGNTVYVDVLCYGRHEGVLQRVLATYARQGMHEGEVAIPRATTMSTAGRLDPQKENPANMDGDHVIVGFIEDDLKQPFIQAFVPHPSADIGNDKKRVGHRIRMKEGDGSPRFWKHKGGFWGMDSTGNYVVDLTRAHNGKYLADGKEPEPTLDGDSGNYKLRVPEGSKVTLEVTKTAQNGETDSGDSTTVVIENSKITVKVEDGNTVVFEDKDGSAKMTVGDGAVKVAIADHLRTLWEAFQQNLSTYNQIQATGGGSICALGPVFQVVPVLPNPWSPTIESNKVKITDG